MKTFSRTSIKNLLYKVAEHMTKSIYSDEDWKHVDALKNILTTNLKAANPDWNIYFFVENGGYHTSKDGLNQWKQYNYTIEDENEEVVLEGHINCHPAGTVNDPFSKYDMTFHCFLAD